MTDKRIYQCCYTNRTQTTGSGVRSGWGTAAVSENIPLPARKKCEQLQGSNSTIQGKMTDENGEILNLLEICGDGQFVYILRTKYSPNDRTGRGNMFSHAYILHWEDVLDDPNAFLRLTDRANFRTDEEAARQLLQNPAREPDAARDYTIADAMTEAGISTETYPTLIQCVYSRLSDRRTREPLYIQCSGEEQMHALLFCIYYGLPRYLRKQLHAASAVGNRTDNKHIIFSRLAAQKKLYLNPQTGETKALTARTLNKIERYGFIDYAVRHMEDTTYFDRLSEEAVKLGDPEASNEEILKIAHKRLVNPDVSQYSDSELVDLLSDALRSQSYDSMQMIDYIVQMMERVLRDKRTLTDACRNDLDKWESAVVLTKEQLEERDRLERKYNDQAWTLQTRQAIAKAIETKYKALLETRQREMAAEENENLAANIKTMEIEQQRFLEGLILKAYAEKEKEITAERRDYEENYYKPLIEKRIHERYDSQYADIEKELNSDSEQARKFAQEKEARIVRAMQEGFESTYKILREMLAHFWEKKFVDECKKIEEMLTEEQEAKKIYYADELKKRAKVNMMRRFKEAEEELNRKKEKELERLYNELEKYLEARKPKNLRGLEAKGKLAQAIKEYRAYYITCLSPEEAVQFFGGMSPAYLEKYMLIFSESADGREILDAYYEKLLQDQPHSWEQLCNVLTGSSYLEDRPKKLTDQIERIAWDLYEQSLKPAEGRVPDYDRYTAIIQKLPLSEKEIGLREAKAKETFWERISLENFTQEDAPLYNKMVLKSKRCEMFSSFYSICSMITDLPHVKEGDFPDSDRERFLQAVQDFFSRFHSILCPAERTAAQQMLGKKVITRYSGEEALLAHWIPVMMEVDSESLYQKVSAVRTAICGRRYGDLVSAYIDLYKSKPKRANELFKAIRDVILLYCDRRDGKTEIIPLDVWLIAASSQPARAFDIFDLRSPAILECDSYEVIAGSRLMKDPKYIRAAENYVRDHGQESKNVKKWLNEARQSKRDGDKRPEGGGWRFSPFK